MLHSGSKEHFVCCSLWHRSNPYRYVYMYFKSYYIRRSTHVFRFSAFSSRCFFPFFINLLWAIYGGPALRALNKFIFSIHRLICGPLLYMSRILQKTSRAKIWMSRSGNAYLSRKQSHLRQRIFIWRTLNALCICCTCLALYRRAFVLR